MTVAKELDTPTVRLPTTAVWGVCLWLAAAVVFALSGALRALPPPIFPLLILGPVLAISIVYLKTPAIEQALSTWRLEPALAFHVLRAPIGIAFLFEMDAGRLHPTFATIAGYGDIAAGLGALALLSMPRLVVQATQKNAEPHRLLWAWNALALLDIIVVVFTAQRIMIFGEGPSAMKGLFHLPYPLIPLVIVPLVFLTHLWIFRRLRGES